MISPEAIGGTVCDALDHFTARPRAEQTKAAWDDLVAKLHAQLVAPDPLRGSAGLLAILRVGARFPYQNLAGELLLRSTPPCALTLAEAVELIEQRFNASAHKTAEYLQRVFGKDALVAALRARGEHASPQTRARVRSFLYCLGEG